MTFEEFKDTYYKDYKLIEETIDKDESLGYEQISWSMSNWRKILSDNNEQTENVLESYSSEEVRNQIELAQDLLSLMQSERFRENLSLFIKEEMVGEVFSNIKERMSMTDIMSFLDHSETEPAALISGRI